MALGCVGSCHSEPAATNPFRHSSARVNSGTDEQQRASELVVAAMEASLRGGVEGRAAWTIALMFAERAEVGEKSKATIWSNAGSRMLELHDAEPHEYLIAHEALQRLRTLGEHPGVNAEVELQQFWQHHGDKLRACEAYRESARYQFAFVTEFPGNTVVSLDDADLCRVPCTVPVPTDGKAHVLRVHTDPVREFKWVPRLREPAPEIRADA